MLSVASGGRKDWTRRGPVFATNSTQQRRYAAAMRAVASITVKGSPYLITERRVPELIPVLGSQPAGDVSHKPGGRLPLFSARPAVTKGLLPVLLLGK